jgi:hypothetical protein
VHYSKLIELHKHIDQSRLCSAYERVTKGTNGMGLILGLIATIIVFVVLIAVGGVLITAFAWIAVGILALILFFFFGFLLKWFLIILLIIGICKLLKRMFTR